MAEAGRERLDLDAVFYDFDGVIADSVETKVNAYRIMFGYLGAEAVDKILDYNFQHGGLSRYVKFQWTYDTIIKQPLSDEMMQSLGRQFSEIVEHEVVKCPYIEGAIESIDWLHKWNVPMYIVSGTPQDELRRITAARGLDPKFTGVFGSPRLKPDIVRAVLAERGFSPGRCLFIGDAMTDYKCANETGLQFLGIVKPTELNPFPLTTTTTSSVIAGIRALLAAVKK